MKNLNKPLLILFLFCFGLCFAQKTEDLKKLTPEQRSLLIQNLTTDQKIFMLQEYKQNLIFEELQIPENKKDEFGVLYDEYQNSQKIIKGSFHKKKDYEILTDEEAQKELEISFEVGQKLLENRKEFCKKFQKIIKPQQVLQLFENEGKIRSMFRERKGDMQNEIPIEALREKHQKNKRLKTSGDDK